MSPGRRFRGRVTHTDPLAVQCVPVLEPSAALSGEDLQSRVPSCRCPRFSANVHPVAGAKSFGRQGRLGIQRMHRLSTWMQGTNE